MSTANTGSNRPILLFYHCKSCPNVPKKVFVNILVFLAILSYVLKRFQLLSHKNQHNSWEQQWVHSCNMYTSGRTAMDLLQYIQIQSLPLMTEFTQFALILSKVSTFLALVYACFLPLPYPFMQKMQTQSIKPVINVYIQNVMFSPTFGCSLCSGWKARFIVIAGKAGRIKLPVALW